MKKLIAWILTGCFSAMAFAQQTNQPPRHVPELNKLAVYWGQWRYEGETKPGPLGPGTKVTGHATGEMILRGFFLEWRWKDEEATGATQGIEILGYSPVTKNYPSSAFSDNGNSMSGEYVVGGNTSTFAGTLIAGGKQYRIRAKELFAADLMTFTRTEEISVDGKIWIPCYECKFTKVMPGQKK